ncbi:sigma-70 family RNA polymerase sigma factor [Phyllobacterium sp. 21LDTY02-6]|uniref:sigma-70 family RNA polymerase sigma factor n=1 Tax=Phyllobacterium sp. 21LDTY02-6 TaxID=2944903 RepID=UPI0020214456|nr:sigma-70 family RNA polymerase sigma factor [Phyllobacterium sp. 21LDTY02-6]MCO4319787.1 sigma-70 family RNA polymerase sigma factor [Phyllobacterium sp. 21LDTY02-6]
MPWKATVPQPDGSANSFARLRPRLTRIAYRMTGSVAEAEDIVQEGFIRWYQADRSKVRNEEAFLVRIITRLSLDHLKSARARRESYVGNWLPEPIIAPGAESAEMDDDITLTLMLALERLSPLERAAFLLHDVFGQDFGQVAEAIDRDPAACRQLASRARQHVQKAKPRFPVSSEQGANIARAFFAASRTGDTAGLRSLLADDVVLYSDGGGNRVATINPVVTVANVCRFFERTARRENFTAPPLLYEGPIDGLPGLVTMETDGIAQSMAFEIEHGRIKSIYVVRNPQKLAHLRFAQAPSGGTA